MFAIKKDFNKNTVVQDTWILKARTGVIPLRNPGGVTSQVPLTQRNGFEFTYYGNSFRNEFTYYGNSLIHHVFLKSILFLFLKYIQNIINIERRNRKKREE